MAKGQECQTDYRVFEKALIRKQQYKLEEGGNRHADHTYTDRAYRQSLDVAAS